MKRIVSFGLSLIMIFTALGMTENVFSDTEEIIGSYNVIGLENMDYEMDLKVITRSTEFVMDDEKLSFYMLGCDLVEQGDDYYKFIVRDNEYGAKFVFISPEAGRVSGAFSTADFYPDRNSIMRVKDVDYITYRNVDGTWMVEIGEDVLNPNIIYVETGVDGDKLKTENGVGEEGNFSLNLDNYTLSKENAEFVFFHGFDNGSVIDAVMDDAGITFRSTEIMFRTFESRLSSDATFGVIYTDRRPSDALIGQTIRFTGNSDDGDNLATIQSVDPEHNKIYIDRVNGLSYNLHNEGTWIRTYNDYSNGQVTPNEYPKISVSPSFWTIQESEFQSLMNTITGADPTGLLGTVNVELDTNDSFGYSLRNVTYNSDGLNFTGGLNGAFYIGFGFDFFGRDVSIDPIRIDYGSAATSLTDQILRINTYKSEAIRFNFNPDDFGGYAQFADMGSFNPPDTFPLRFRIYFDKNMEVIGGNVRINLPGKGIPLPGGLIYIDNIGGGYRIPNTYEVGAQFTSYELGAGFALWQAEAEMELSIDQKYLEIEGSSWIFGKKIQIGDFDATVAWSYYTGKRFKGVEVSGEVGVSKASVELIVELTFKVKRYKSDGETKTYVGGKGEASIEAFGYTFAGVSVSANTSRFKAGVKVPILGYKSVYVKYADVVRNITSLSPPEGIESSYSLNNEIDYYGVASYYDKIGNYIILVPEATRLEHYSSPEYMLNTITLSNNIVEGAIVIDYTGDLDDISVTLPNGTTKAVLIAEESMTYDSDYLYAMDYEISDTTRQLYIQLDSPLIGDYDVDTGDTVISEINLYEITQIPNAELFDVSVSSDIATLEWELNEDIDNTKYHLTLQEVNDQDEVVEEYLLYEDYINELEEEFEIYVPEQAIVENGLERTLDMLLPDYLPDGSYRFVLEPVLVNGEDETFPGEMVYSSMFVIDNPEGVPQTTLLTSDYIGDGLSEIQFTNVVDATGYEIIFTDSSGIVETISMTSADLVANGNIDGGTITVTLSLDQEASADYYLSNLIYEQPYTYVINTIKEVVEVASDEYDPINGYLVIENIMLVQDGSVLYITESNASSITFKEYNKIQVSANLESGTYVQDTGVVNEDIVLTTEYEYDPEDDTVDIEYLTINVPDQVYSMPGLSQLEFSPDQEIKEFGIKIQGPQGEILFDLPVIQMSLYQDYATYLAFYSQLMTLSSQYTTDQINVFIQLYNDDVFSFSGNAISIDLNAIIESGLMDDFDDGIYTIHVDMYNANGDHSPADFSVRITDFIPGVFIESIIKNGDYYYVNGLVNGATSLTLNDVNASVVDGYFEAIIPITESSIDYALFSLFNTQFTGTIVLNDDLNVPLITLSNTDDITITEGMEYTLPTCSATDIETQDMECIVTGESEITDNPGIYLITYSAIDDYGNQAEDIVIRLEILDDTSIPTVTLSSYENITITIGDSYDLPTCIGSDEIFGEVLCDISYSPVIDDTEEGVYTISYSVTDINGNTSEAVEIILTINEQEIDPVENCQDGYHLEGIDCVEDESPSNVGLIISVISGGVIVIGGGVVLLYFKKIRI
jgi:hypothetical protein